MLHCDCRRITKNSLLLIVIMNTYGEHCLSLAQNVLRGVLMLHYDCRRMTKNSLLLIAIMNTYGEPHCLSLA